MKRISFYDRARCDLIDSANEAALLKYGEDRNMIDAEADRAIEAHLCYARSALRQQKMRKKPFGFLIPAIAVLILTAIIAGFAVYKSETNDSLSKGKDITYMHAEWPDVSFDELIESSELIIRGTCTGYSESYIEDDLPFTDYYFEVAETVKGACAENDIVTVKCYGGTTETEELTLVGMPKIEIGNEFVLILSPETDAEGEVVPNGRYRFYPPRGILSADGSGVYTAADPSVSYTVEQLREKIS